MATMKAEIQAIADQMTLDNDGLPKATEDVTTIGQFMEHSVRVGKDAFSLARFMDWMRKKERMLKVEAESASAPGVITFKVSRKGTVSVYGLQRFPITLKVEQWQRLFAKKQEFEAWVASNPVTHHPFKAAATYRGKFQPAQEEMDAKIVWGIQGGNYEEQDIAGKPASEDEVAKQLGLRTAPGTQRQAG